MSESVRCCPLCDCDNVQQKPSPYSQGEWRMKTCANCQLLYLENPLPYEELEENYAWTKTWRQHALKRATRHSFIVWFSKKFKYARKRWAPHAKARNLVRRFVGHGKILDVGCGHGWWLRQLDEGFTPYGIEIDKLAAEAANSYATRRGGQVYKTDALSGLRSLDAGQFDAVIMQSYLEHETRPLEVLRATRRVLRPAALLIIESPQFRQLEPSLDGAGLVGIPLSGPRELFQCPHSPSDGHPGRLTGGPVQHARPSAHERQFVDHGPEGRMIKAKRQNDGLGYVGSRTNLKSAASQLVRLDHA